MSQNIVRTAGKTFGEPGDFSISVGTDHPTNSYYGGKTVVDFRECENLAMKLSIDGHPVVRPNFLRIEIQGDTECDKFIEALELAVEILKSQRKLNAMSTGEEKLLT